MYPPFHTATCSMSRLTATPAALRSRTAQAAAPPPPLLPTAQRAAADRQPALLRQADTFSWITVAILAQCPAMSCTLPLPQRKRTLTLSNEINLTQIRCNIEILKSVKYK